MRSNETILLPTGSREKANQSLSSTSLPYLGSSLEAELDTGVTLSKAPVSDEVGRPAPRYCLPEGYGQDCITLLVRDPDWVFAYWEVATPSPRFGEDRYQRTIRLYRCHPRDGRRRILDIAASSARGNWYINVPDADSEYYAEVGYLYPDGEFRPVACSNQIHTPPSSPSNVLDEEWMSVDCEFFSFYLTAVQGELSGSEELLGERVKLSSKANYLSSPFAHPSACE